MEKQTATILSAELSGFQDMTENLSPNEIRSLMNEVHNLIETTVRLHNGKLSRFSGDTFLAAFNYNKSVSRASVDAVDAAFELNEQLVSFINDKEIDTPFRLKTGIASGNVISAEIGLEEKKQETIMGEAVNHANRICRFAGEGQILVDENTHEVVRDRCEFQMLEPIPLKGGDKTLGVFELLGKKRIKLKPEEFSERKITSEMVGRNREMELIEVHIKKLMAGEGSVVNIVGKAGIGKSRLIDEIRIQPLMKKTALLEGRAQSIGKNLSFHPIVHIIKSWAGITEEDPPSVSPGKLQQSIIRVAHEQADEIFPFLATMMGMPLEGKHKERVAGIEGEALEKLILKNLRDLIAAAATIRPLIILIEDLHWADTSSITFLESLFKLVRKNQILFINVFRPGHKETGDFIQEFLNENLPEDHITIKIDPLIETESRELIGNLLHTSSLPAGVCEMIIRKTEGNPFFIEEVIRSFIDDGIIKIKDNEFFITEKIHEANIPETINEVILSRVDKLDEKTKDLLKTASVIGRNFYYKVLEEAADTIGELDDRIEYLKDVQLIGESKKKEEIEFLFKHALAQQATYESIILNTKKELHLKIARSIEKVFAENLHEHYGSLAYHYGKAENLEKAEEYLIKSGDEAMKSAASSEAIYFYKRALQVYLQNVNFQPDSQKTTNLEEKIAFALFAKGNNIEAVEYFDKVFSFYDLSFPRPGILKITNLLISLLRLFILMNFPQIRSKKEYNETDDKLLRIIYAKGKALATFNPKRIFLESPYLSKFLFKIKVSSLFHSVAILASLGTVFFWTGRAVKFGSRLLQFAKTFVNNNDRVAQLEYIWPKNMHQYLIGKLNEKTEIDKHFETGMQYGEYWPLTVFSVFTGLNLIELGKQKEAEYIIDRMNDACEAFENSLSWAQHFRLKSAFHTKFRNIDKAISTTSDAVKYVEKTDHIGMLLLINCSRSVICSVNSNLDEAKQSLVKAEKLLEKFRIKLYDSKCSIARSYIEIEELKIAEANQTKDIDQQKKTLLKITKIAINSSKKVAGNFTEAYRLRAVALDLCNKNKAALKCFSKSIKFAKWYGGKLELSRTYFELGKFLSDPETKYNDLNGNSASYYLEKAKSMFEEMNLQWDLEEYRKFMDTGD